MNAAVERRGKSLAPALAGLLLAVAYPPYNQGWAAWIAPVLLWWAWQGRAPGRGPLAGTILGGLLWSAALFHPLWVVEGGTWAQRWGGFAAVCAALIAFLLAFALLWRRLAGPGAPGWRTALAGAASWVALEYGLRQAAAGFSPYLGVTQWQGPLLNAAAYGGVHGVSALIVLGSGALAAALGGAVRTPPGVHRARAGSGRKPQGEGRAAASGWAVALGGAALVALLLSSGGLLRVPDAKADQSLAANAGGTAFIAVLVQPGWSPADYDAAAAGGIGGHERLLSQVLAASRAAVENLQGDPGLGRSLGEPDGGPAEPVLVIWPETTLHVPALSIPRFAAMVHAFARESHVALLAGLPHPAPADRPGGAAHPSAPEFNSAFFIDASGNIAGRYDKVYVIPIAEAHYRGGERVAALPASPAPGWDGPAIGVGICSDAVEPRHAREAVLAGATSLHYLASLGRIGRLARLEEAFLAFRAAEHRLHVTQVATTGPTKVVGPDGRTLQALESSEAGALAQRIPARSGEPTVYTVYGDWPVAAAGLLLLAFGMGDALPWRSKGRRGGGGQRRRGRGAAAHQR